LYEKKDAGCVNIEGKFLIETKPELKIEEKKELTPQVLA
jgi:hypothetical protein